MPHNDTIKKLRERIKQLEAILVCAKCGHLRNEHDEENGPCYGGRTPEMKSSEGEYCMCHGFSTDEGE